MHLGLAFHQYAKDARRLTTKLIEKVRNSCKEYVSGQHF